MTYLDEPWVVGFWEGRLLVGECGECHCGVQPHLVVLLAQIEKLAVLGHAHVRDNQP